LRFCTTRPRLPADPSAIELHDKTFLGEILGELRKQTGRDFSIYTQDTFLRRLRRRMQLRHVATLAEYLTVLARQPDEATAFASDLLWMPSEFFQDQTTFRELEQRIIPKICAPRSNKRNRVRAWTIGCSTGEEA